MHKLFEVFNSDETPTTARDFIAAVNKAGVRGTYNDAQLYLIFEAFTVAFESLMG